MKNSTLLPPSPDILAALKAGTVNYEAFQFDFKGVDLRGACLSNTSLLGVHLKGAILSDANLEGADLRGANLHSADLRGANLHGASLNRAMLQKADLSGANLTDARLQVAYYDSLTIWPSGYSYKNSGAIGPQAILNGAYLCTADLRDVDFQNTSLLGAYLNGADLTGANLQNARLSGSTMRLAFLTGAYLRNARLNGVDLQGADLRAADLSNVEMENLQSIAGADFSLVQGLSEANRAMLLKRPTTELDVWNPYTRRTTRQSLSGSV